MKPSSTHTISTAKKLHPAALVFLLLQCLLGVQSDTNTNLPPVFSQLLNNIVLSENTPVGSVVYTLEGFDPEGSNVTYGLIGSEHFQVDSVSGNITLIKALDREEKDSLSFLVTLRDRVNPDGESDQDNVVSVPITCIVLDENDNPPEFQNTPYETDVNEDAPIGTTIFDKILLKDRDIIGESLDIKCIPQSDKSNACRMFSLIVLSREPTLLKAAVVLNGTLNYNEQMIYRFQIAATDDVHETATNFEVRVKDVQDRPPVFQGSLSAVIDEDSPINTLVLKIQARDGDTGEPRKIVFDLLTNPMDYFLLDEQSGELRTAKPLDREALSDNTGIIALKIRARELINGQPSNDPLNSSIGQVTVTIRDVNDSPPKFNKKEYEVSLPENTAPGTPLSLDMSVSDADVGINAKFSLYLDDVLGVFEIEPTHVIGSSQVNIRVGNKTLDYENPNQRKFIVLVIAEETETNPKLSSTATITVTVQDANDNKPRFEQESYSATISEAALPGQYIATIKAKDIDSGSFGEEGIRYSLTGTGSELFRVDERSGVITLANCHSLHGRDDGHHESNNLSEEYPHHRERRQIDDYMSEELMAGDSSGSQSVEMRIESLEMQTTTTTIAPLTTTEEYVTEQPRSLANNFVSATTVSVTLKPAATPAPVAIGAGKHHSTCLDYETESTYFLSYKATDDNGQGQTSVVSLRISVLDANDSPPVCESPLYRASIDEGAQAFDSPLTVHARDADTFSDIHYRIIGDEKINQFFEIDESGHITIRKNASLDVTNLNVENLVFTVEADDGLFKAYCGVNITIRDVNNHSPKFLSEEYSAVVEENSEIGTSVEKLQAVDLDTGINAELRYRIEHGSFEDFRIDDRTGEVFVARKLDFDRRNTYKIEILATDLGTPSLSGTATLRITIVNSNDKDPYFTPSTQHAEIREDAPTGTVVHTLMALDPDVANHNALHFAATDITAIDKDGKELPKSDEFKEYFTITRTGNVLVNKRLNRELFAIIRINVLVTDSTAPTVQQGRGLLIIQIIDVNEVAPKFNYPWTLENPVIKLQMAEELPVGSVLTTLQATDEDSTISEYNISANDYFQINKTTGEITSIARIDYEAVKEVKFMATVTDSGIPPLNATAEVTVDIINQNDNEPRFEKLEYNFNVTENSPRMSVVGKVEAFDKDLGSFGEIGYKLIGENDKYFTIDPHTGTITVSDPSILDHEKTKKLMLTVVAQDKAPATVQKTSTTVVYINILDVNDNKPVFTQKIYNATIAENAALNALLLQVKAMDLDEGIFGDVRYFVISGNDENLFRLDAQTGILYPAQSLNGKHGIYELDVAARDTQGAGSEEASAKIFINVRSVNQHRPVFVIPALSNATIEIPGDIVKPNYLLLTVKAVDNDTDKNGEISYHLQLHNQNVQETEEFKIDATSGELRTNQELNRNVRANYDIILVARDAGNPTPFETLRFLSISIVDANENRPEFPDLSNPYKFSVSENDERNLKIGRIQATTRSRHYKDVYYYMLWGNEDNAFFIDRVTGDIFTNKSLDREAVDSYTLYILASIKPDFDISEEERASFSIKTMERDDSVAKVYISVLDVNDNPPTFEKPIYYAGINAKSSINSLITTVNATDADAGNNAKIEYMIVASNLYKFGAKKSTGSIVPSPFAISSEGRLTNSAFMAEYNQDRFELEIVAREIEAPQAMATTKVFVWVFDSSQLVRVILSRPPEEVYNEQEEIIAELRNATNHRIIVDEIRFHVDNHGRIRMDWCDLFFHAVDQQNQQIAPVDGILKVIDANYDYLKDYYAGFAIENVVPAYVTIVQDDFDLAMAGLVALIIVLFVGIISFIVLCCCLKHWNLTVPVESRRKDQLIKKQIIEDLNTTENPLWIEQKLKLYEEQELTMQVFSEPDHISNSESPINLEGRGPMEHMHPPVDNTYATIQPRNPSHRVSHMDPASINPADFADYATLRNNRAPPSMFEFTGSTFQAPVREGDDNEDIVAELI